MPKTNHEIFQKGYKVIPRAAWKWPLRIRQLYFELMYLAVYAPRIDPKTGLHLQPGDTPPITYSFLANRLSTKDRIITPKMVRDDLKKLGHLSGDVRSRRGHCAVVVSIGHYRASQKLRSFTGHNKVTERSTNGQQTNVSTDDLQSSEVHQDVQSPNGDLSSPSASDLAKLWNEIVEDSLPRVKLPLSDAYRKHATARVKQHPDLQEWTQVIGYILGDDFYCGDNDRGWRANFRYLIRPNTFVEIMERVESQGQEESFICSLCGGDGKRYDGTTCKRCGGVGRHGRDKLV